VNARPQIFLSYAGEDSFEAALLQHAVEALLRDVNALVWTYERDQSRDERHIAASLRDRIRRSVATIVLISQFTLTSGATQWMELAYADAFGVPTFILLHHITYDGLKTSETGVPPLVLEGQCTPAADWRLIQDDLRRCCNQPPALSAPGGHT
jgi:hypothetical protein